MGDSHTTVQTAVMRFYSQEAVRSHSKTDPVLAGKQSIKQNLAGTPNLSRGIFYDT